MSIEETRKIIEEIIECALSWCNDDNDDPAPIPPEWETVLPLLRAAPRLLEACKALVEEAKEDSQNPSLIAAFELARAAHAAIAKAERRSDTLPPTA